MKTKTIILAILVAAALAVLTACGGSAKPAEGNDPAEGSVAETKAAQKVRLLEYGYCVTEDNYIKYGFVIENPSEDTAYEFPDVTVTAYDENGDVLATGDQMMETIQPGEKQAFGSLLDCNGAEPGKVEFDVVSGDAATPSEEAIRSSDFEITGTNERVDEYDETAVTGKIRNNSGKDSESAAVTVLFKKEGQIVCGTTSFVDNIGAGSEKAFEVTEYGVPEHDSYEVSAIDW